MISLERQAGIGSCTREDLVTDPGGSRGHRCFLSRGVASVLSILSMTQPALCTQNISLASVWRIGGEEGRRGDQLGADCSPGERWWGLLCRLMFSDVT